MRADFFSKVRVRLSPLRSPALAGPRSSRDAARSLSAQAARQCGLALAGIMLTACATDKDKVAAAPADSTKPFAASAEKSLLAQLFPTVQTAAEAIALGDSSLREGKDEMALVYYLRAYDIDRRSVTALEKMTDIYARRHELRLMDLALETILSIAPRHPAANERLGLSRLNERRYAEAETLLKRAVAVNPRLWQSINALGVLEDLRGNHQAAVARYRSALPLVPDSPLLISNIGYSHYLAGDQRRAREYLGQALSVAPDYGRAARNLALVEVKDGHYQTALVLLSRVMRNHAAYNNLGYLCMMKGDYVQARKFLGESIAAAPNYYPRAHENLKQLDLLEQRVRDGS